MSPRQAIHLVLAALGVAAMLALVAASPLRAQNSDQFVWRLIEEFRRPD